MKLYAFKDVKIGFMEPIVQTNDEVAKRTFKTTITDGRAMVSKYKEDIELWSLGEWNEQTGEIIPKTEYIIGGKDINGDENSGN